MAYNRQESRMTTASAPPGRMDSQQSTRKMDRFKRYMKTSVADFFGLGEDDPTKAPRWDNRRMRYRGHLGKLKDEYLKQDDELDGMISTADARMIRDPFRVPGGRASDSTSMRTALSSTSTFANSNLKQRRRKDSVMKMTMKGLATLAGAKKKFKAKQSLKGVRSIAPGSFGADIPFDDETNGYMPPTPLTGGDDSSLIDDVFYDELEYEFGDKLDNIKEESTRSRDGSFPTAPTIPDSAPSKGWRRPPPPALPDTPAVDVVDGIDFKALKKIPHQLLDSALQKHKRAVGQGIIGKFFHRSVRSDKVTRDVKKQIDEMDDHRPYFTYWVTFVQIVIFIVSVSVYGIAPIGIDTTDYYETVTMPNLAIQRVAHRERDNLWLGPRQADLIHLGAKYTPCMRFDENLNDALQLDVAEERNSACCVRNDGSGCAQMTKSRCSSILSTFEKWSYADGNPGPDNRTSGTVCGQDPRYCAKPVSVEPFLWPDDITKWPVCEEVNTPNVSLASTEIQHMSCEVVGHPCCHGIQGECIITTREHCDLIRGYYHDDKFLCSQVDCLSQICGMITFYNKGLPDQVYRLWTSLFLHGGLFHLIITIIFQWFIMRDVEKLSGAIRIAFVYLGSGIAGNLASSIFLPYQVEAGPSGSQFGILACLFVEVFQSWQMYKRPFVALLRLLIPVLFLFILGLLPWFDNWAHLFGFIFGLLIAFVFMPYLSFGKFDRKRKIIGIVISLCVTLILYVLLIILLYIIPIRDCEACQYFNCIPFTSDFCENMGVSIKRNSTYSNF
ncbi:hypothetical protein SNE40_018757 [Patella caerulea]|uniref:Peptidase S54 rhomboid domain-containing protein n=1 Tax=Patella caerulea TaxID=87958 RepID=A0AAN8J886_PATCE